MIVIIVYNNRLNCKSFENIKLRGDSIFVIPLNPQIYIFKAFLHPQVAGKFFLTHECGLWIFSAEQATFNPNETLKRAVYTRNETKKQSTNLFIMHKLHPCVNLLKSDNPRNFLTNSLIFSVSYNYFLWTLNIPQPLQWKIKNSHKRKIIILLYLIFDEPFIERNLLISSVGSRGYLHWFRPSICWWRAGP